MDIYWTRHGLILRNFLMKQSGKQWDASWKQIPGLDLLTPLGHEQGRILGEYLGSVLPRKAITSGLSRTQLTAANIGTGAQRPIIVQPHAELDEVVPLDYKVLNSHDPQTQQYILSKVPTAQVYLDRITLAQGRDKFMVAREFAHHVRSEYPQLRDDLAHEIGASTHSYFKRICDASEDSILMVSHAIISQGFFRQISTGDVAPVPPLGNCDLVTMSYNGNFQIKSYMSFSQIEQIVAARK